jgi:hypothetical protein
MEVLNSTASDVGKEQLNVAFMTGILNRFAKHLAFAAMRAA